MTDGRIKFSKILKDIRNRNNLSQEDVEWESGISRKTISKLETANFKEASISSLIDLSRIYGEDLVDLYLKYCFRSDILFREIIESLDMSAMFMTYDELSVLNKKLDIIKKDRHFKMKEEDLLLIELFIDRLSDKNMTINTYKNRYEDIVKSKPLNIQDKKYSPIELRIVTEIAFKLKGYEGISIYDILNSFSEKTEGSYSNLIVTNIDINMLIVERKYEHALLIIKDKISFASEKGYYDCLIYLYYDKFICEYRLGIGNYRESLNKSLFLAKLCKKDALINLIEQKSEKLKKQTKIH